MTKDEAIKKLLEAAAKEIGYASSVGKNNKYAKYMDSVTNYYNGKKNGFDWCEVFVDYMFLVTFGNPKGRLMVRQPEKSLGAACPYSANYYIKAGAWSSKPEKGAQAFLGKRGDEYHTGIVESFTSSTVTLIEGNAGGGNGKVMRRTWNISNFSGFGIPDWSQVAEVTPSPSPAPKKNTPVTAKDIERIASEIGYKAINVLRGVYGKERKAKLGEWYDPVQWVINKAYKEKE